MNKRFSTLLAAALVAGGVGAYAQTPIEDVVKKSDVTKNGKNEITAINLSDNVKTDGDNYLLIDDDDVVLNGNDKTLNGRLVITGKNVTVKNLNINYVQKAKSPAVDYSVAVNKTAITVVAPSVTIEGVDVVCSKDKSADANALTNGITIFPTNDKAELKLKNNTVTSANADVTGWNSTAYQIVKGYTLSRTGLTELEGTSAKTLSKFDFEAFVKNNKAEKSSVDFAYCSFASNATYDGYVVTPIYNEAKELVNKAAVEALAGTNFVKDAFVKFNGTPEQLSEALGDKVLADNVVIETSEGQVNKLNKYATIFNSDKKYYTVQTEKGFLSAATTASKAVYVENGTIRHEILWSFGFEGDSYVKGKKSKLQNAESGVSFELPVLASENVLVVADKANTYVVDGVEYTVTPVDMVEQTVSYLTIDDEDLRHEVYRLGIYSPVWGGVSYFTENHGKPSHVIGLDPNALENGNVSEWTFALKSTVKVDRYYFWYDETKDANDKAKGWTKGTVKFEIPVYTLTNQYEETLGWNKDEKKYGAKETAIGFIFKKVGDYYNMVEVGTEVKPTSLFANSNSKVFGAHSADLGFLDKTSLYNPVQNDLVYISDPDLSYDYRHLTAEEKFVTFSELNIPTNKLSEEGKFLISGDKCQDVDAIKMLAHTVWEPKKESGLAQYLLALDTKEVMGDTIWCNASSTHKHATLKDSLNCVHTMVSRDSLFGRFLVCYVDSAKAFADNSDYHRPGDANEYVNNGLFRLGFVEGVHIHGVEKEAGKMVEKNELIIKNPEGRLSTADKAFNQAKFAFKYVEPVASVNEDAPFVIETAYFNAGDYKMNGTGFLRNINGVVVVTKDQADATVFTLNPEEGGSTANEEIATSEVTVIAGEGQLTIAGAAGKKVVVSNILGQVVVNTVLSSDNATIAAPQGVVVVAVEGEEAVKAIVK